MRIMVVTKNGSIIKSKVLTEEDVSEHDLGIYVRLAEQAGNANMTGSVTLPMDYAVDATAVININNIDHMVFIEPLYSDD